MNGKIKVPPPTVGRGNKRLDPLVLKAMIDEGMTLVEVGRVFGVSRQRVSHLVGVTGRRIHRLARKTEQARKVLPVIKERVSKGEAIAAVCRDLGLSEYVVYHTLGVRKVKSK